MELEVWESIEACLVCARNKTTSKARTGLLQPLPIPSRPWSDISIDFVTRLPVSQGNTTVLTEVDWFSKLVKFIALPKLPSTMEIAEMIMNSVFRVHGFEGPCFRLGAPLFPDNEMEVSVPSTYAMVRRC